MSRLEQWVATGAICLSLLALAYAVYMAGAMGRYRAVDTGSFIWVVDGLTGQRRACYNTKIAAQSVSAAADATGCVRAEDLRY